MSGDYTVGKGKPPKEHQFGPGNKAAAGRRRKSKALTVPQLLTKAFHTRRKIKRGNEVVTMAAGEILVERLVQMMINGNPREIALVLNQLEKHAPELLQGPQETLEVIYRGAENSRVSLPPRELWEPRP